ncbi:hypothetical protein [Bdellovibrio sp. HCB209]|uniref:hypothetical protein n=1 Tax=Bdellovibrio sp. HCB209 TaxID=3394354 RepID=UPI0039B69C86
MTARSGVFLFTFVTLTSLFAKAYPSIGDKVTWSGDFKNAEGKSSEIHITKEVIAFEKSTKTWKVKINTKIGDETLAETIETADLFSPDKYKETLASCEKNGGVIETLETNPGKYKTCKISITNADGVIIEKWWGDIPFGIVSKATKVPPTVANSEAALRVAAQGL